jgi:hypothetical protein
MAGDDFRNNRDDRGEFRAEEPVLERKGTYEEAPTRLTSGGAAMGPHHYLHCRDLTDDKACSLIFAGHEDEVVHAAHQHLTTHHEHHDHNELRDQIRRAMKKVPPGFFN